MAKYKCENCGADFFVDQKERRWLSDEKCPSCGSTWTRYVGPGLQVPVAAEKEEKKE